MVRRRIADAPLGSARRRGRWNGAALGMPPFALHEAKKMLPAARETANIKRGGRPMVERFIGQDSNLTAGALAND
ncbi:MAG TPA: hypothetical protein VGF86_05420 [Candidatus Tumulicola sp.]